MKKWKAIGQMVIICVLGSIGAGLVRFHIDHVLLEATLFSVIAALTYAAIFHVSRQVDR